MKTLIIREGSWDWACYLFFVVLIGASIYFMVQAYRSLVLFPKRKKGIIADVKVGYREKLIVNLYLAANSMLWMAMVLSSFFLIWLFYRDTFDGFTKAQISDGKVKLFYMWPMPSRDVAHSDIGGIDKAKWGKNSDVIHIVTSTGTFKSVSNDPEQIDADCRELRKDLAIDGR